MPFTPHRTIFSLSPRGNVTYLMLLQEENGGPYKASIPLIQATNPEADVLLAYEMNGEVIYTTTYSYLNAYGHCPLTGFCDFVQ